MTMNMLSLKKDSPFSATNYLNNLLLLVTQKHASDIHCEPQEKTWRIRIRLDGLLHEIDYLTEAEGQLLASRIKILAQLDIAEKRLPQDGHWQDKQHHFDYRVSTCPILYGEKIVIRCLNKQHNCEFSSLGLSQAQKDLFLKTLANPHGLILVTGPTGSGKTITLYAALQHLNQNTINIASLEDPVEKPLPGINQTHVLPKAGLTFSKTLRALLRQDPDVIMVGEMRDLETIEIALTAAQTGHLVLSTLHTNSASETIIRLLQLNIPAHQIINSLRLIVAQRLVRCVCPYCYAKKSCSYCYEGYLGRTAIYELLPLDDNLAEIILKAPSHLAIKNYLSAIAWHDMRQNGLEKIAAGITTKEELARVLIT